MVGRIVLYHPSRGERYYGLSLAAVVSFVNDSGTVNLMVIDPSGLPMSRPTVCVPFVDGGEIPETTGYCTPMGDGELCAVKVDHTGQHVNVVDELPDADAVDEVYRKIDASALVRAVAGVPPQDVPSVGESPKAVVETPTKKVKRSYRKTKGS